MGQRDFSMNNTHKLLIMFSSRWIEIRGDSGRRRLHHYFVVGGCKGRR